MGTIIYNRRSIRIPGYDYSRPGKYFITPCAHNREPIFGRIAKNSIRLTDCGEIVQRCWHEIPLHYPNVVLDEFIIMPDHFHGIVVIDPTGARPIGARHAVPQLAVPILNQHEQFGKPTVGSIPTIVRSFKSAVTKRINELRVNLGKPVWQRGYYLHIIKDDLALNRIRRYIQNNVRHHCGS